MQKNIKSLPKYVLDENHFKDFEYDFDYCIIHKENDNDYFTGTTASALAEYNVFKDAESLTYFIALLIISKILISVSIYPQGLNKKRIMTLPDCKNDSYLYLKNTNLIPHIKIANKIRFFNVFLSIREIHDIPKNYSFLYIDFETVFKWIKKHRTEIDTIAFDPFAKYDYAWYINVDDFIKQIELFKKSIKNYKGKNIISDLHTISLQKHMRK